MEQLIDIRWNNDGSRVYEPDNQCCKGDNEEDTMDVFFVRNYHKTLGYDKIDECFWLVPRSNLANGLRALTTNKELMEMCQAARLNDGVVDVYYKHGVSRPHVVEDFGVTSHAATTTEAFDDEDVAEVDEATFLNSKQKPPSTTNPTPSSPKASPPKPNPLSNNNPNPISSKASHKSSPLKPHPNNIKKPTNNTISKASPNSKQKPNPKVSPHYNRNPNPKFMSKLNPTSNVNPTTKNKVPGIQIGKQITPKISLGSRKPHCAASDRGKQKIEEENSSDDDDSEDSTYKPCDFESSSDDDDYASEDSIHKQSRKHYASAHQSRKHFASQAANERHNILQDVDGLVEDDSDSDQVLAMGS
ncbi:hypothetical protein PIB30_046537 [Stylosanthes scabra]|uniref:PB1-like domain-containing protein n=1 Tax=Stylosanthes scabra TaxID=79078 RepID=A0ABU6SGQ2_9FABA|nr:hypothetical protein [Stylosanthes scabra]